MNSLPPADPSLQERYDEVQLRQQLERRLERLVESLLARPDDCAVAALPALTTGMLIAGRYRIATLLGQGAMGVVYEVTRIADGRRFAAKLLGVKPDHQALARFAREAQLLARLQHPNLVAIVDADVTPDLVAYIIMEQAPGKSLAECYSRFGDRDFMLPILYQLADALAAVHAAGVVHRDVKPGNVLVSMDGATAQAKLVDFGVARLFAGTTLDAPAENAPQQVPSPVVPTGGPALLSAQSLRAQAVAPAAPPPSAKSAPRNVVTLPLAATPARRSAPIDGEQPDGVQRPRSAAALTQSGTLLGTLLYMAPELRGGANLAHPPSDIFSFGVMTYEVLTGTLPFDELPLLRVDFDGAAPKFTPLVDLCPWLSPELARTLASCLAVEPARRPTAAELVAALYKAQRDSLAARLRPHSSAGTSAALFLPAIDPLRVPP